jgi:hypothetical protein
MTMSEFLPITLDVESVTIQDEGKGWGIVIETVEYGELYAYEEPCDPLYDMLFDQGVLTLEEGDVVKNTGDEE